MNHLSTSAHPFVNQRSAALWNWKYWNQFKIKLIPDSFVHFGKPDYLTFLQIFAYCSAVHRRLWALADKHPHSFSLRREFVSKREKGKWSRQLPASIIHLFTTQPRCGVWRRMAAWRQQFDLRYSKLRQIAADLFAAPCHRCRQSSLRQAFNPLCLCRGGKARRYFSFISYFDRGSADSTSLSWVFNLSGRAAPNISSL